MKRILLLLVTLSFSYKINAQESRFKEGETLNVWAQSGLNMRDKPDAKAPKLTTIPYGAKVIVQPNIGVKIPFEVEEFKGFIVKGYWLLVKYGNTEGFVFDGFLSRLPAPAKNDTLSLEGYLDKQIGKIGGQFDFRVYDGINGNIIRKARPNEKIREKGIAGFSQKYNQNIQFSKSDGEGGYSFEIRGSELTLCEGYVLVKTFFFDLETDIFRFDKTQKIIISGQKISSYGCSFTVKMVGNKMIISGGCYC
jgi:Bacterial SH3 domain